MPIFLATLAIRQQSQRITFQSAAEMLDLIAERVYARIEKQVTSDENGPADYF